jgi:hypothetical protein
MRSKRLFGLGLIVLAMLTTLALSQFPAFGQAEEHDMSGADLDADTAELIGQVREATADFRDTKKAEDAGYGKFLDCFTNEDIGGMGQHLVNGDLVGDDVLDPLKPEALVYEPEEDGSMILVAMEYLVFQDNWKSDEPPTLFGQEFHLRTNIPETPPVWALHIWLWSGNPEGLFADYNPIIFCPKDYPLTIPA